jgi:hypothetical protein
MSSDRKFDRWLAEVNRLLDAALGLDLDSMEDLPTRDAFDDGVEPCDFFAEHVQPLLEGGVSGGSDPVRR